MFVGQHRCLLNAQGPTVMATVRPSVEMATYFIRTGWLGATLWLHPSQSRHTAPREITLCAGEASPSPWTCLTLLESFGEKCRRIWQLPSIGLQPARLISDQ